MIQLCKFSLQIPYFSYFWLPLISSFLSLLSCASAVMMPNSCLQKNIIRLFVRFGCGDTAIWSLSCKTGLWVLDQIVRVGTHPSLTIHVCSFIFAIFVLLTTSSNVFDSPLWTQSQSFGQRLEELMTYMEIRIWHVLCRMENSSGR